MIVHRIAKLQKAEDLQREGLRIRLHFQEGEGERKVKKTPPKQSQSIKRNLKAVVTRLFKELWYQIKIIQIFDIRH